MKENQLYSDVFKWLGVGLFTTFLSGFIFSKLMLPPTFMIVSVVLTLIAGIYLSARAFKMSKEKATITYLLYTLLTGVAFSSIFVSFKLSTLTIVFLITSLLMLILSFVATKVGPEFLDMGKYLMIMLVGLIIASIFTMVFNIEGLEMTFTYISIIIFMGFVVYDIKRVLMIAEREIDGENNIAIYSAFMLYLDFINLFIDILRIVASSQKD